MHWSVLVPVKNSSAAIRHLIWLLWFAALHFWLSCSFGDKVVVPVLVCLTSNFSLVAPSKESEIQCKASCKVTRVVKAIEKYVNQSDGVYLSSTDS